MNCPFHIVMSWSKITPQSLLLSKKKILGNSIWHLIYPIYEKSYRDLSKEMSTPMETEKLLPYHLQNYSSNAAGDLHLVLKIRTFLLILFNIISIKNFPNIVSIGNHNNNLSSGYCIKGRLGLSTLSTGSLVPIVHRKP